MRPDDAACRLFVRGLHLAPAVAGPHSACDVDAVRFLATRAWLVSPTTDGYGRLRGSAS